MVSFPQVSPLVCYTFKNVILKTVVKPTRFTKAAILLLYNAFLIHYILVQF